MCFWKLSSGTLRLGPEMFWNLYPEACWGHILVCDGYALNMFLEASVHRRVEHLTKPSVSDTRQMGGSVLETTLGKWIMRRSVCLSELLIKHMVAASKTYGICIMELFGWTPEIVSPSPPSPTHSRLSLHSPSLNPSYSGDILMRRISLLLLISIL